MGKFHRNLYLCVGLSFVFCIISILGLYFSGLVSVSFYLKHLYVHLFTFSRFSCNDSRQGRARQSHPPCRDVRSSRPCNLDLPVVLRCGRYVGLTPLGSLTNVEVCSVEMGSKPTVTEDD